MDVIECITSRRSVRKFLPIPVEDEKLANILLSAKSAPTAGNLQDFRFILIKNEDTIRAMSDACLQQYWISTAPAIIVVCADAEKLEYYYGIRGSRLYSVQDCAAATQNILLAAHSQGLGACWVGAFNETQVARILSIPSNIRPQAIIPLGYADEIPPEPGHRTMEDLVFLEKYGKKIEDMDWLIKNYRIIQRAKDKTSEFGKIIKKEKETLLKKLIKRYKKNKEE